MKLKDLIDDLDNGTGVTLTEILHHSADADLSSYAVLDSLSDLYRSGEIYMPETGRFKTA